MLSNPSASSPKRLRIRGDELLRLSSGFLCYFVAYQLLPSLSPWTHPPGGQGLCLVPAPPVCTCLHRLKLRRATFIEWNGSLLPRQVEGVLFYSRA